MYQASTRELFGKVEEVPQRETTPFHPYSPYAVAKQYGFLIVQGSREAMACTPATVSCSTTSRSAGAENCYPEDHAGGGRIVCGLQNKLPLGNLDSLRDWGYAKDYVECMWLMLQQDKPEDFVIATGVQHTVRSLPNWHSAMWVLSWNGRGKA